MYFSVQLDILQTIKQEVVLLDALRTQIILHSGKVERVYHYVHRLLQQNIMQTIIQELVLMIVFQLII